MADRPDVQSNPERAEGSPAPPAAADQARRKQQKRTTRRRVLLASGGALGWAGVMAAGGYVIYDRRERFDRTAVRTIRDHRVQLPRSAPRMAIARGGDPAPTVRAALDGLGGMQRFVSADDVVLIKPNVGWDRGPSHAANTHPDVVAELVRACRDVGVKRVMVTDCPVATARRTFQRSGILRAAGEAGAEVVLPEESRYHTVKLSERLGTWDVLEPFVVATKIINAPIAKHNSLSMVTGGMKNWIGITTYRRMTFHADIHQSIAELAALMRPTLTVIDASRVLMRNGPQGGNLADVKDVGAVVASVDPIAADAWACGLVAERSEKLPDYLHIGERLGLGRIDYRALEPVEVTIG